MGRITEALKKATDERLARIQKRPYVQYVVKRIESTTIEQNVVSFHDPSSPVGEQYKIMRTNIQALRYTKGYRAFVITSSIHGEGKTVTAANLAMSMAHDLNTKSVLLIDADMRRGKVSRYLGINRSPGLAELLNGESEPDDVFVSPAVENLVVIPSGRIPKNPSELLGTKKMEGLIEAFKSRFDYLFIDTPPVMNVTDACILGAVTDGVVLVIQAGRTQRDLILHSETRLNQARAKILGYVMTNIEYHLPQYLYRYVQDYGHYAYKEQHS